MVTKNGRKDLRRLLFFSLGGVFVGLFIAGLIALLIDNVAAEPNASGWRETDDLVVIYFHLRDGATWPDGSPITADDVVFSYNAVLLNADASNGSPAERVCPDDMGFLCEKVDDYVVRFTINASARPEMVAMGFDILPKNELAEYIYNLNPDVPAGTFTDRLTLD